MFSEKYSESVRFNQRSRTNRGEGWEERESRQIQTQIDGWIERK